MESDPIDPEALVRLRATDVGLRRLDRGTPLPMVRTVPAVSIVKDLVLAGLSLELNDVNRLHPRSVTGRGPGVNRLDRHALGEEVELTHVAGTGQRHVVAFKLMIRCTSFLR